MRKDTVMAVQGYEVGPIACEAAFVADFDIDRAIPIQGFISAMDSDRRVMATRAGMIMKYTPLRFDPATGAHQIGGRYLFETCQQMREYMRFTSEELEFEPGVKFWERPFFSNIQRSAWRVVGAHVFMPVETHYASRFERLTLRAPSSITSIEAAWPVVREAAAEQGLASVWLLVDPDGRHVALLTVAVRQAGPSAADRASRSISLLEHRNSLSHCLDVSVEQPSFDRTSLNIAVWLPRSDALGGEACIFPTYPVHPLPMASP